MSGSTMPAYVDRWGMHGSFQSFTCTGIVSYDFVFKGNTTNLQSLCDRYLNLPGQSAFTYRPLVPYIFLTFTQIASMSSSQLPYSQCGWMPETEVTIWMLTLARHGIDAYVAWFVPYMFVGNPRALTQGREIYGFPKEIGYFNLPWIGPSPQLLTLDAQVLPQFDSETEIKQGRVLEVAQIGQQALQPSPTSVTEGLEWIKALLTSEQDTSLQFPDTLLDGVVPRNGQVLLLKQLPDIGNSGDACYQTLVQAPITITKWTDFARLPGDHRLTLPTLASHPIAGDLGIEDQQSATIAYSTAYDFVLEAGTPIWPA
jgi:hypothetical protein